MKNVPLTSEQGQFAADNHNLVYKFLNDRSLVVDDYYDIVIFGYLDAVRQYFMKPALKKYAFATVAFRTMQFDLGTYNKSLKYKKRNAEVLSIHQELFHDGPILGDTLPARDVLMEHLEDKLLYHELAKYVSKQQMDVVRLKSSGYGLQEIAKTKKIRMKAATDILEEVRVILLELCKG